MILFHHAAEDGWPGWGRTTDIRINSPAFYRLNYRPMADAAERRRMLAPRMVAELRITYGRRSTLPACDPGNELQVRQPHDFKPAEAGDSILEPEVRF